MRLVLAHCEIRSWSKADIPSLVRHADDAAVARNLRDRFPHPYTAADAATWVRAATRDRPQTSFAIAVGGEAIGSEAIGGIGLQIQDDVYRRSAEVGYWLGREYWGHGIATEALRGFSDWAFAHYDLCRLFAYVFATNPASRRVLEKAGYAFEGRMRAAVTKERRTLDQDLFALIDPARVLAGPGAV